MSGTTEIYICKPGQAIREGKVEYSSIETRGEAEADAARRVGKDPTIANITYYAVKEDGDFRSLYRFDNPQAASAPVRPISGAKSRKATGPMRSSRRRTAIWASRCSAPGADVVTLPRS